MAVTFQHKIVLRPGSVFCFGTISSVADEEGTLHRIADPPERKSSSKISGKIGVGQEKAQPPVLRAKTTFSKLGAKVPPSSKESGMKLVIAAVPFYPDVLFIGIVESPPVSDDEPTAPGKNLLNGNPADEETDAETFDDITRPGNGTQRNPYREMRSRK
jgi:hypothetical protein